MLTCFRLPRSRRLDRWHDRSAVRGDRQHIARRHGRALPTFRNLYGLFAPRHRVHGIYRFGLLPRITRPIEMLVAALMPIFILFGWIAARPATARVGAMLANLLPVQLALTVSYSADFSSFANSSIALMLGVGLTGVICGSFASSGPAGSREDCSEATGRRLLRSPTQVMARIVSRLLV